MRSNPALLRSDVARHQEPLKTNNYTTKENSMSDPSLMSKIDKAIEKQTKYLADLAETISTTDSRLHDRHTKLRQELEVAQGVLTALERKKVNETPCGPYGGGSFFSGGN
jgi:hypothetical protein